MSKNTSLSSQKTDPHHRFLISEYLRLGSIDAVFKAHPNQIYLSYPTFARLKKDWNGHGVVDKAGPNTSLHEILHLLTLLADSPSSLESFFRRHVPHQIKTSVHTCYRVLQKIKQGTVRRRGTILLISPQKEPSSLLVAKDNSLNNSSFGQAGNLSFPMTYSKKGEGSVLSVRRVLEREVFTQQVINGTFPYHLIPKSPTLFLQIILADILVDVFLLKLPPSWQKNFSSFKLQEHTFLTLEQILQSELKNSFRPGLIEIAQTYSQYLINPDSIPQQISPQICQLNQKLAYAYNQER